MNAMNKTLSIALISLGGLSLQAQENTLKIGGYAEVYYQYGFNNPMNNARPSFVYSHHRNNEVALNLGMIKASYNTERLRANLALAAGSYMNANYAAEEGVLKNVYEANVGFKLSAEHKLWLDAGILPSHIGWESAISADCMTLTRSIAAENSPYFETGAKLSYESPSGAWTISAFVLNGWQRIQRINGNSSLAVAHQLVYKPSEKFSFNSSSYIGNESPDSLRRNRYFHNFYGSVAVGDKLRLLAGFDIGAEQKAKGSDAYNVWYSPVLIARYALSDKVAMALRGEYYQDKNGVIIAVEDPEGFQTFGYSLNVDYRILPNLIWRTELKNMDSKGAVFTDRDGAAKRADAVAVTSLAVSF